MGRTCDTSERLGALDVARSQQAKSLKLRAALSLSRLRQQQNKREKACKLLAGVYESFTGSFDTADLKEARARLEELSKSHFLKAK